MCFLAVGMMDVSFYEITSYIGEGQKAQKGQHADRVVPLWWLKNNLFFRPGVEVVLAFQAETPSLAANKILAIVSK